MTGNDAMIALPPLKPTTPAATATPPEPFMLARPQEKPVVLDMGEASREQGFRLNGCR